MRRLFAAALLLAAGCFAEAQKAEVETAKVDLNRPRLKLAHIAAPRVHAEDAASKRRLEEAVGVASAIVGLDAVVFGGDVIANETAAGAAEELDVFASLAGIVAARRIVVFGERERGGALPRDEVARTLEKKKLLPSRASTYSDAPNPTVRVLAIDVEADGSVSGESRRAAEEALAAAKEPCIVVVADRPPLDPKLADLLRADLRVKALVFRATLAVVDEKPGEPLTVTSPPVDGPTGRISIRVIEIDGRTCRVRLVSVPGGADDGAPRDVRLR